MDGSAWRINRRCYVSGGSFFFTVVTERRAAILGDDPSPDLLRAAFRACRQRWPFRVDASVMLRDHLDAIWTLPPGDTDYSKRWGAIKQTFHTILAGAGWAETTANGIAFTLPSARHGGFENIPCGMNRTTGGISITSTITRSNMGW